MQSGVSLKKKTVGEGEVALSTVYTEILNLKSKIDRIEHILIPEEEISKEELKELETRREEMLRGESIKLEVLLKKHKK